MHHARAALARWVAIFVACSMIAAGSNSVHAQAVKALTDQLPIEGDYNAAALDDAGAFVYFDSNVNLAGGDPLPRLQAMEFETSTGQSAQLTALPDGVVPGSVAVSDDGAWLVFLSTSNPLGLNADRSVELFIMQPDGSQLDQLTDISGSDEGTIYHLAFAGSGNRVAFVSDNDPLATNGSHIPQIFVIDSDGTDLAQISDHTVSHGWFTDWSRISISDDGQRIAYSHPGDPVGGNPEGNFEIFAVNYDGTGLRQLTSTTADDAIWPFLSGNGQKIVFESFNCIWIVNWDGTGLQQLTTLGTSITPSITDDASVVVYTGTAPPYYLFFEILKMNADGTEQTPLTTYGGSEGPVVSGDGNRIVFRTGGALPGGLNEDGGYVLVSMDSSGGDLKLLVELEEHFHSEPDITSDGTRVAFLSDPFDPVTNPTRASQVFRVQADGSELTQVTEFIDGEAWRLGGISDDGELIAFSATADPVGCNDVGIRKILTVDADGTTFNQASECPATGGLTDYPTIAADGSVVAFQSNEDPDGDNGDQSPELFRYNVVHSGPPHRRLDQLTSDDDGAYKLPRLDGSGTWVVFQSAGDPLGENPDGSHEVFRIDTDGNGLEQLTDDAAHWSLWPDISATGGRVVYASTYDPLGTNTEENREIFLLEPATAMITQLTFTPSGESTHPSISDDGAWVYFKSNAPFFEPNTDGWYEPYRVEVATGTVERVGGLRAGSLGDSDSKRDFSVYPDGDGDRAVFAIGGDWSGTNPDGSSEVFLIDFNAPTTIEVSKETPTVVSWTVEPQPVRYDVIRGDIASLQLGGGNTVDLGAVYCVENDSADNDTVGDEDPVEPAPGEAFFYVRRGSQGVNDGPGSWGQGTGGRERAAGAGVCDP